MTPIWAVNEAAFQAFVQDMALKIRVGLPPEALIETPPAPDCAAIDDAKRAGLPVAKSGSVAIVNLAGPMMKRPGGIYRFFGFASTSDVRAAIRAAEADEEIDQIVLRIDSPGGTVDGTLELAEEVRKAEKPVIAQVDGMAASAAYWVASQAGSILASRMDMVGSIGVRMMVYDFSGMFEQAGVRAVPIDTGPFKSAGAMGTPLTEEQQAYFQALVDDHFSEFRKAVMTGRGMNDSQFEAVGDGRVFSTPDALQLGLVDRMQGIDETFSRFRQQATRRARLALSTTA